MSDLMGITEASRELDLHPSRVRALIAQGALSADKVGGRWLVNRDSVVARRRAPVRSGRPIAARNAWMLLLDASGETIPGDTDPVARWRMRQMLRTDGLVVARWLLERRGRAHVLWGLPGELHALLAGDALVLTGSSAAGALGLELAAPDTIDAYVPATRLAALVREHGLEEASAPQANVVLRAVPDDAWMLDDRRVAPRAAVALDLASYLDSRSARVGMELLERLDHGVDTAG